MQFSLKTAVLFILFSSALLSGETFSAYFSRGLNYLYNENQSAFVNLQQENREWFAPLELYRSFWQSRLNHFNNRQDVPDQINALLKHEYSGLSIAEKNLLKGLLAGMLASLEAEESFWNPLSNGKLALDYLEQARSAFPDETAFGLGAAHLTAVMFFDNNFAVRSIIGFQPSLWQGIKLLNQSALQGKTVRVEALLFLNEYYAGIEENFRRAAVYSELLVKNYPQNLYFNYLHGVNLFKTNQFSQSRVYLNKAGQIKQHFYPFQYDALLLEAETYYYSVLLSEANMVNNLAGSLFPGNHYQDLKFRLLAIERKTAAEIQKSVSPDIINKYKIDGRIDLAVCRKYFLQEIAVRQSGNVDNMLTFLPALNSFNSDFRDKILLTMQDFVLNLNINENDSRRILNKLTGFLKSKDALASGELNKIRLELYNRRYDQAAKLFASINRQYPLSLNRHENSRRIKIWQRITAAAN